MSDFVSISKSSGASGTTSATVTVAANDDYKDKSASVTVQSKKNPAVKQSILVSQTSAGVVDLSSSGLTAPLSGVMSVGTLAYKGDSKYKKGDFSSNTLRFYPSLQSVEYTGNEDDLVQIYEGSNTMPSLEIDWTEMDKLSGGSGYTGLYGKLNSGSNIIVPNGNKAVRESRYTQPITGYVSLTKDGVSVSSISFKGVSQEEVGTVTSENEYFITVMRGASGYDIPVSDMRELKFAAVPNDEASIDFANSAIFGGGSIVSTSGNKTTFCCTSLSAFTPTDLSYTVYVWSKVGHEENKSKTIGGKTFRWNDSGFSFSVIQEKGVVSEPGYLSLVNSDTEYYGGLTPREAFNKYGDGSALYAYLSECKYNTGELGPMLGQVYCPDSISDILVIHPTNESLRGVLNVLNGDLYEYEGPIYINVTQRDDAYGEMASCDFGFEIRTLEDADTLYDGLVSIMNTLDEGTDFDIPETIFYVTDTTLFSSAVSGTVINGDAETFNVGVYAEITDSSGTKYYHKLGECMLDQDDELDITRTSDSVPYQCKSGLEVTAIIVGIDSFSTAIFSLTDGSCAVRNNAFPTNSYKIANADNEMLSNFANPSIGVTAGYRFPILSTGGAVDTMTVKQGMYSGNDIKIDSLNISISNLG